MGQSSSGRKGTPWPELPTSGLKPELWEEFQGSAGVLGMEKVRTLFHMDLSLCPWGYMYPGEVVGEW